MGAGREAWGVKCLMGRVPVKEDQKVLGMDGVDDCTIQKYLILQNYTLQNGDKFHVCFCSFKP